MSESKLNIAWKFSINLKSFSQGVVDRSLYTSLNTRQYFFTFWMKLKNVLFSLFYNATVHSYNCDLFYFAWPNLNFHFDMFDEWLNDSAKQNNTKTKHGSCPIKTVRLINKRRRISTKKNTIVFIRFTPIVHTDERLIYYSANIIRQHLNVCSCICCSHFVSFLTK